MPNGIIQGRLLKRGHMLNKNWKPRLFVLRSQDGTLGYFDDSAKSGQLKLKGKIHVRDAKIDPLDPRSTEFVITTTENIDYALSAETTLVKRKWVDVLVKVAAGCSDSDELQLAWDSAQAPEDERPQQDEAVEEVKFEDVEDDEDDDDDVQTNPFSQPLVLSPPPPPTPAPQQPPPADEDDDVPVVAERPPPSAHDRTLDVAAGLEADAEAKRAAKAAQANDGPCACACNGFFNLFRSSRLPAASSGKFA